MKINIRDVLEQKTDTGNASVDVEKVLSGTGKAGTGEGETESAKSEKVEPEKTGIKKAETEQAEIKSGKTGRTEADNPVKTEADTASGNAVTNASDEEISNGSSSTGIEPTADCDFLETASNDSSTVDSEQAIVDRNLAAEGNRSSDTKEIVEPAESKEKESSAIIFEEEQRETRNEQSTEDNDFVELEVDDSVVVASEQVGADGSTAAEENRSSDVKETIETVDVDSVDSDDELLESVSVKAEETDGDDTTDEADSVFSGRFNAWTRKYGSLAAIAAAMIVLLAVMFAYTTMIPRTVSAVIDGEKTEIVTKEHTIEGFIASEGIKYCEEDFISIPLTGFVYDGMPFELKHAADFTVTADGRTIRFKSLAETVEEALEEKGINVRKRDIVTPERSALLEDDMEIVVQRVETEKITAREKVPFDTVKKKDKSMAEGDTKVITEGKNGKDKVIYEVTYIDGEETSRKELSRENIKEAVDEVVAVGTQVEYDGKLYSRKLVVKAYSYTGGGTTAMGTKARVGEIAVDPSVIPLGTNVYIPGVGARRAEDTGGNIKGNTIDIYMNTRSECINWGARYITIYIE